MRLLPIIQTHPYLILCILLELLFFNYKMTVASGTRVSSIISDGQHDYTDVFKNQTIANLLNGLQSIPIDGNLIEAAESLKNLSISSSDTIIFTSVEYFYSCKELLEIFKDVSSGLISHELIDCEDMLVAEQSQAPNSKEHAYTEKSKSILCTFLRHFLCAIKMHIMHKTKMLMHLKIISHIQY